VKSSISSPARKSRSSGQASQAARFEIVREAPRQEAPAWSELGSNLLPYLAKGRDLLDDIYVSGAKFLLARKEELEDRLAERKARKRIGDRLRKTDKPAFETEHVGAGTGVANSLNGRKPA
jgi:hypothetical protein